MKDSITNGIYYLILAEVLARDIFMSNSVTGLFPSVGIKQIKLAVTFDVFEFFFSVASISKGSSPVISDPYHRGRDPKPFLLSYYHKYRVSLPQQHVLGPVAAVSVHFSSSCLLFALLGKGSHCAYLCSEVGCGLCLVRSPEGNTLLSFPNSSANREPTVII